MATYLCLVSACLFLFANSGLYCDGQKFHVKHAPPYIKLQTQTPDSSVRSSDLHNILASPLGLSNEQNPIIQSKSILKRPKANVLFTVVTHKNQELPVDSVASYKMDWDDFPFVDVEQLMNSLQSKFLDKDPTMLDLQSNNRFFDIKTSSSMFQSLPSSFDSAHARFLDPESSFLNRLAKLPSGISLNSSHPSDGEFLAELQMVDDILSKLKSKAVNTKIPDLLSFTLTGLQRVVEEHGAGSQQAKDAQDIVIKHLNQIVEELKTLYKGNVIVSLLTVPHVDVAKVRKTRSLMQVAAPSNSNLTAARLNLEIDWYQDCPAIFNIVLWLMIILTITIFFVAYGIWNLNPNLESILYRVPQDDLKKMN